MKAKTKQKRLTPEILLEKRLLTPYELAASLNVPVWYARKLWQAGRIPVIRLGHRTVRFDFNAVIKALEAEKAPTTSRQ